MLNRAARTDLIQQLRTPMRPNKLRATAETLMKGTRYTDLNRFLKALQDGAIIHACSLESRNGKRWRLYSSHPIEEFAPHQIAAALFPDGYFCNLTAIYHHGLTHQVPNSVYICHETIRPRKRVSTEPPSESAIRTAFLKPHRHTNLVIPFQGHDLIVLDRARDTDYGVVDVRHDGHLCPAGSRITCLERTLIDSVVAPQYNGGLTSLPSYFKAARKKMNIEKLIILYGQLRFLYPYAQAIGFMLDSAGMKKQADQLRKTYPPRRKFFIDHGAKTAWRFNERWMLYHPGELTYED